MSNYRSISIILIIAIVATVAIIGGCEDAQKMVSPNDNSTLSITPPLSGDDLVPQYVLDAIDNPRFNAYIYPIRDELDIPFNLEREAYIEPPLPFVSDDPIVKAKKHPSIAWQLIYAHEKNHAAVEDWIPSHHIWIPRQSNTRHPPYVFKKGEIGYIIVEFLFPPSRTTRPIIKEIPLGFDKTQVRVINLDRDDDDGAYVYLDAENRLFIKFEFLQNEPGQNYTSIVYRKFNMLDSDGQLPLASFSIVRIVGENE